MTDIADRLYVKPGRREEFIRLMRWHQVVTNFESQVRRKDGITIWISENVRAVRDRHGKFLYYEGTATDITERKEAEQRLVNSETLYHSLVETLPQFILRKDLMERFTFGNQRFCNMMGTTLDELIGKTDFDFFPAELAEKYQSDDRKVMETGELFETVETVQPPGKDPSYVNVVKTPLHDAEGKIIGLQGIFWDITERVVAEQRERKANEELAVSREELRLKNEQLEKDQAMAREIQQAFFTTQYPVFPSTELPQHSRIQFYHRYLPAGSVSGDFFNVMQISDSKAGVFISDVMGHGVRSALITAMLRALLEELRPIANDPGEFLTQLNLDLRTILKQSGTPMFTTAFYLLVDLDAEEFRFANAGHPKPLLISGVDGNTLFVSNGNGQPQPAMGLFDNTAYQASAMPFKRGDAVLLYTDGLIEIENETGEWYDSEKLLGSVQAKSGAARLNVVCDGVLNDIREFAQSEVFEDDVCLLGVKIS
jgi:sigma-B regulation protein RsbU (phosphoserine phosphatase)